MAPLPYNNTCVFRLSYNTCGRSHDLIMRTFDTVDNTVAINAIASFLSALGSQIYLLTVLGLTRQAEGASYSVDVPWTGAATYGASGGPDEYNAVYVDFIGRSLTGRRARVAVFGYKNFSFGTDYRATSAESAEVAAAVAVLNANPVYWTAIDNGVTVWKPYGNVGVNAYWRNRLR